MDGTRLGILVCFKYWALGLLGKTLDTKVAGLCNFVAQILLLWSWVVSGVTSRCCCFVCVCVCSESQPTSCCLVSCCVCALPPRCLCIVRLGFTSRCWFIFRRAWLLFFVPFVFLPASSSFSGVSLAVKFKIIIVPHWSLVSARQ